MNTRDEKSHIDVRIDDPHRTALLQLVKISGQKTAISTLRNLIRDAAKEAGVWPEYEMAQVLDTSSLDLAEIAQ